MALVINTNLSSINGQRNLSNSTIEKSTAMQRLSLGVRVNNAKDDAAGLAITNRMNSQIHGMTVAIRNANDGISLTQTAESSLGSLTDTLQRMRDLAVQSSSNAGVSDSDRAKMQTEFKALNDELMRIVQNSEFNGKKVLNGDLESGLNIQIGSTTDANSQINVAISNISELLSPVSETTLYASGEPMDSLLAAKATEIGTAIASNLQLQNASDAATLANAAVVAAKAASESPTDLALAKAASDANFRAANLLAASSADITNITGENLTNGLVSDAFSIIVNNANATNVNLYTLATNTYNASQNARSTNEFDVASLLNIATQLADATASNVKFAGQNVFATAMNAITGGALQATSVGGNISNSDQNAYQKALIAITIAKNIADASYIQDPTKTQTENETNKNTFIDNYYLVVENTAAIANFDADFALKAIDTIDTIIAAIDSQRSDLGSIQNRFTTTVSNLQSNIENQSVAKSRIMDADFAQETANVSRAQILQTVSTAMLAQANQSGKTVMTLLK